jgi:hypothetical protein
MDHERHNPRSTRDISQLNTEEKSLMSKSDRDDTKK